MLLWNCGPLSNGGMILKGKTGLAEKPVPAPLVHHMDYPGSDGCSPLAGSEQPVHYKWRNIKRNFSPYNITAT
jgi:hypothetical protein